MNALEAIGTVAASGAAGGLVAYLSSSGLRKKLELDDGPSETGFLGTMILGAMAAALSWALQSPHDAIKVSGTLQANEIPTFGDLAADAGVGLAGAKWLVQHYQANFFKFVGARSALRPPDEAAALAIANGDRRAAASSLELTP